MPSPVRYAVVAAMFRGAGWWLGRVRGSHHVFTDGTRSFSVPVHQNKVKHAYVREIEKLLAKP